MGKKRKRKLRLFPRGQGPAGKPNPNAPFRCIVCDTPMTKKRGYAGQDMCGPCCTGDSSTLEEFGDTW